ncbi:MAG: asparagine synthase (glutamine-hydrolyzing) [Candidatus Omnitrophota bacterium]|nr:asparagine synthase (glutamine-hydrolyzing) [Candidatus Omnitrophota bacterium]
MCGICGFNWNDKQLIKKLCKTLVHRGPDSEGYFSDTNISLGCCRLSIIDLEKGNQPIFNEDRSLCITFNGEIYNHKELRFDLEKKGHKFYTDVDTEVVIHSYEEYGAGCLKRLKGMFAFAIWDSRTKQLFLARDRLGIKPLYYYFNNGNFVFASELKAILLFKEVKRQVNLNTLNNLLTFRYASGEETILEGIKKLLPGHFLVLKKNLLSKNKYWDINFTSEKTDAQSSKAELRQLLKNSVQEHLESDVLVGVFLSGGVDSSSIVALMKKTENIKTFTLGFSETDNNEFVYARKVAQLFNTDHTEIVIEPKTIRHLPEIIWYLDEPLADPTCIPTFILSQTAGKTVKVVLSGEGADEVFGGYEQYKIMKLARAYNRLTPTFFKKYAISPFLKTLPKDLFFEKLKDFATNLDDSPRSYVTLLSIFNRSEKELLYSPSLLKRIPEIDSDVNSVKPYFSSNSELNNMLLTDTKTWLPDNMLLKFDKMTMANSIEGRVPFLDHEIVEFASKLHPSLKLKGLNEKYILKLAMAKDLPKSIVSRKKQRFPLPIDSWFSKELRAYSSSVLSDPKFLESGFFNARFVSKLLNYQNTLSYKLVLKHNSLSRLYYSRQIWMLLTFELWYKTFIEREDVSKPLNKNNF